MQLIIQPTGAIPAEDHPKIVKRLLQEGANNVSMDREANRVSVVVSIFDGNEPYIAIAKTLAEFESYYQKFD